MQAKVRFIALLLVIFMLSAPSIPAIPGFGQSITGAGEISEGAPTNSDGATPMDVGVVTFTEVTESANLWGLNGTSVAWGDYNNDGYQDLLVDGRRLFKNNGTPYYNFTDVTALVGLNSPMPRVGVWGDYDNDGYLDLYVAGGNETVEGDRLFRNTGPDNDWKFSDATMLAGDITDGHPSASAGWADYDRDGYLDLFVGAKETVNDTGFQDVYTYYENVLWHNNGDGTFTNVTYDAGLNNNLSQRYSRSVSWADFNNDCWPDMYVSNYGLQANFFYVNTRNGTFDAFEERAAEFDIAGINDGGPDTFGNSIGAAWADIDNDGDLDLWVSNIAKKVDITPLNPDVPNNQDDSYLFENQGRTNDYTFENIRDDSKIPVLDVQLPPSPGPGPMPDVVPEEDFSGIAWGDYDNDGFMDLFIPQMFGDLINASYDNSFLYRNQHNNSFEETSQTANIRTYNTSVGAWADYDNDGFLDLITGGKRELSNDTSYNLHLFRNEGNSASWLTIDLEGVSSNSVGIGAHVTVFAGTESYFREIEGGMGSQGMQNSIPIEFGLGGYTGTVDIEIRWPSGIIQLLEDQSTKQFLRIVEPSPDLVLTSVSFSDSKPLKLQTIKLIANIENRGNYALDSGDVLFYFDKIDFEAIIGTAEINTTILPGETGTAYLEWKSGNKVGTFEIFAQINSTTPREKFLDNNGNSDNLTVRKENLSPIAAISITPPEAIVGQDVVTFDASGSYDDNVIDEYHFDFGDGSVSGWTEESQVTHLYNQIGTYQVTLQVQDNNFFFSEYLQVNVTILRVPNNPPTVAIHLISPNPVKQGRTITFNGSAQDVDGSILGYIWTSSENGILSDSPVFSIPAADLALGEHTIYFSAYDNEWNISRYAEATLEILPFNTAPVAVFDNIPRETELLGRMLVFKGHGADYDGTVVEYRWESDKHGLLGVGKALYMDTFGVGKHQISFSVRDNDGIWSSPITVDLEIVEGNLDPVAHISGISPSPATVGQNVYFDGYGEDDGTIEEYVWTSFNDGIIGNTSSFSHDNLSIGLHVISFKVMDEFGVWSVGATGELSILPENLKPNATILAVSPARAREGTPVTFTGTGLDVDGTITDYSWRTDLNDYIGSGQSLTVTNLYAGIHTVHFKVRDDRGVWSLEVTTTVTIDLNNIPTPIVTMPLQGQKFYTGDIIKFDAFNTTDGDGDLLTFTWRLGIDIIGTASVFRATLPEGNHTITLTVDDGFGGIATKDVSVVVEKKEVALPPPPTPPPASWSVDSFMENVTKGGTETVLLVGIITLMVVSVAAGAIVSRRRRLTRMG